LVGSCVSEVLGIRKPDPAIFHYALSLCSCDPAGSWMVGDNPQTDIGGARSSGLRTIWLSGGREWPAELSFRPDHVVSTVPEAVDVVVGGSSRATDRHR